MFGYLQEYITELSKYVITVCMAFYTFECFLVFSPAIKDKGGIYFRQSFWLFVIQLVCFIDLAVESKNKEYIIFYVFIQVFFLVVLTLVKLVYENCNRLLLNNMCMLLGTGFCMIARLSFQKALRQFIIVLISVVIAMFLPYLLNKFAFWKKLTWLYAALGSAVLVVVLILGKVTHGSKISYTIQGITFQPSEFVKILFVFFLAAALCENTSFKKVAITAVLAGVQVILLVLSKDLGSALIFFVAFLFVVFVATHNYWYLLAGTLGGCLAAVAAYDLFDHVKVRVLAWRDPWSYIDNQGYQITQSLFAVGSGNWFGMGLYQGNPRSIPYVETDFIFSAICEELGVIFGVCLILVCLSCFIMMIYIAVKQKDSFFKLVAYGLGIVYVFQIFLTVGGGIKFIPLTGVTLPFVSYGGSSCLTTMILFFVIHSLSAKGKREGEKRLVKKTKTEIQS